MVKRNLPGYAIGGMSGGEDKEDFWKTVKLCCELLPEDKPRYVMGVGYPEDLMTAALMGADMFDCVFATRTARFGSAFTRYGTIKVRKDKYTNDFEPLSQGCSCYACQNYTRSYIQRLFANKTDSSAIQLISLHNVHYLIHMLRGLRQSVIDDRAEAYVKKWFTDYFKYDGVPPWINNALAVCNISL
jgi:queuine tRNA-ribosyltransferase